jgi:epoxyqueuosine reductase
VSVLALLEDDDATLLARHGRWYIPDRDPRWLRRNALVVLGNIVHDRDPRTARRVRTVLRHHLGADDPMLVAHAVWAARRLGEHDLLAGLVDHPDPQVRAELAADLTADTVATTTGAAR